MNLRTTLNLVPSPFRIKYSDKVMMIGSCFASSIGTQMKRGKMSVMVNPAGTVYNPVSVANTLDSITDGRIFTREDLHFHNGLWLSFYHNSDFSSEEPDKTLDRINSNLIEASAFLKRTGYLFITFGTARIFRWQHSGLIVSNCHKIPSDEFSHELLSANEIVDLWIRQLDKLSSLYPGLKVIFTISPVRHLKDGAHGNQVSKSVLFLAVESLLSHSSKPSYFPAYEILMDDLRDYRFYDDDMVHPSATALNYIWDLFSGIYIDGDAIKIWKEAEKITNARNHILRTDSKVKKQEFAGKMLKHISDIENRMPSVDFSEEKDYFLALLNK